MISRNKTLLEQVRTHYSTIIPILLLLYPHVIYLSNVNLPIILLLLYHHTTVTIPSYYCYYIIPSYYCYYIIPSYAYYCYYIIILLLLYPAYYCYSTHHTTVTILYHHNMHILLSSYYCYCTQHTTVTIRSYTLLYPVTIPSYYPIFSGADPYCIVKCGRKKVKTPVIKNTLNPTFSSKVNFYISNPATTEVTVQVK